MADSDATGLLQSVVESFKSHISERLTSPFAGAFVFAWVGCNWKALLVLCFSNKEIEDRISYVGTTYFASATEVLWMPLLISVVGIVAYYLSATAFLALYEFYTMVRRGVERLFDRARWVEPGTYIKLKKDAAEKILELTGLASDNLSKLDALGAKVSKAEAELSAREIELKKLEFERNRDSGIIELISAESSQLRAALSDQDQQLAGNRRRLVEYRDAVSIVKKDIDERLSVLLQLIDPERKIPRSLGALYVFVMGFNSEPRLTEDSRRLRDLAEVVASLMGATNKAFGELLKSDVDRADAIGLAEANKGQN